MDAILLNFVKNALRRASQRWKPIIETRKAARRAYKGPKKFQRYEYQCNSCKKYFTSGKVQVHHKIPVGPLRSINNLPGYAIRLFCDEKDLQLLCLKCHKLEHV